MRIGSTKAFRTLLQQTCTIQKAAIIAASAGSYGHEKKNFAAPETVFEGIICRYEPVSLEEQTMLGSDGRHFGTFWVWLPWEFVPEGVLVPERSTIYRIINIADRRSGRLIDAGPFDIDPLTDEAGESHHVKIMVRKTS